MCASTAKTCRRSGTGNGRPDAERRVEQALLRGEVEDITGSPKTWAKNAAGEMLDPPNAEGAGHEAVLPVLFDWIGRQTGSLDAVGHRVVHGGDRFDGPVEVDDGVLTEIEALLEYAPLHQGHNLAAIRAVRTVRPDLRQVACFDTAFHRSMPQLARTLPLPPRLGLERYGFTVCPTNTSQASCR